jgi:N-acetylneuraminate synthase/sialic acid synthase
MQIGKFVVNDDSDCYVIAELGHNHQGDVEIAKKMISAAAYAGVNAVKLQKRNNTELFTQAYYNKPYTSENSYGDTYGKHREYLEFGKAEYLELQKFAESLGVDFFATAFDFSSADFLASLDVPAFKIASGDLTNIPLLKYVATFGKPIVLSTGGGTIADIDRAVDCLSNTTIDFCVMQCTAGYPPTWEELNLNVIRTLRDRFPEIVVGFSSHDNGIAMGLVGYVLGARVVEKHFTLNRASKGTDHAFSLEPPGMQRLVRDLRRARVALGDGVKIQYPSEQEPLLKMGKKLVAAQDLKKGHLLTEKDIAIKSPSDGGLLPYMLPKLLGRKTSREIKADENVLLSDLIAES